MTCALLLSAKMWICWYKPRWETPTDFQARIKPANASFSRPDQTYGIA